MSIKTTYPGWQPWQTSPCHLVTSHQCLVPRLCILWVDLDSGLPKVCDCDEVGACPMMNKMMLYATGQQGKEEEKPVHPIHYTGEMVKQLILKMVNQWANKNNISWPLGVSADRSGESKTAILDDSWEIRVGASTPDWDADTNILRWEEKP